MIGMGIIFLLLAVFYYWRGIRRLQPLRRGSAVRLPLVMALALSIVGLLALVNLVFQVGPF
jgi:hypothetical protein